MIIFSVLKDYTSLGYVYDGDILDTGENSRGYSPAFRYDRFNFRTNLDFNLTKTTQFKVNLSGYYGKQQTPANGIFNMWYSVYKYSPSSALPVYSDGTYGMYGAQNETYIEGWEKKTSNLLIYKRLCNV